MSAPTLFTDGAMVQLTPTLQNRNDTGNEGQILNIATDTYTFTGTEVAGQTIGIIQLPVGCVVKPYLCRIKGNGVAVTATGSLGDSGVGSANNQYSSNISVSSATLDITPTGGAALPKGWDLTGDPTIILSSGAGPTGATVGGQAWITFTFASLSTPTAGKILVFDIVYKQSV